MYFQEFKGIRINSNQQKGMVSSASTKCIPFQKQSNKMGLKKSLIKVPSGETQRQTKIYEWRLKTEFPIVKIDNFFIKSQTQQKSIFLVQLQQFDVRLGSIKELPLFKILYLLKESLIGFERLFNLYGAFMVTSDMIALNDKNKCKVWLNQNFAYNSTTSIDINQGAFLLSIYSLFESKINKLKNSQVFFEELKQYKTFCGALNFIEEYSKTNKINVPNMCIISQKEMAKATEKIFDATLTLNKPPPKFNTKNNLRVSLQNKAKNIVLSIQNDEEQTSIKLKKSQDTAAQKKSSGLQNQDYFFIQNTLFKDQSPQLLARSHLQPQLKPKNNFSRKYSGQYPSMKCCFSPQRSRINFASPKKVPKSKWNENLFTNCEIEQKIKDVTMVNQSKWQKTLNGLFNETQPLKKSIHEGKQKRSAQMCSKFDLLDNFGKAIQQSYVHEEMDSLQY